METQVSVIIPAHNEQDRLPATLQRYAAMLRDRYANAFEIIVVANGCSDDTVRVATELSNTIPEVRVVDIQAPIGKGGAVLEGFEQAVGNSIIFVDADGATAPESMCDLIEQLAHADVVIGSRRACGSTIVRRPPLLRRVFSIFFALCVRLLFSLRHRDTQCGAKAFRHAAAKRLSKYVTEPHWAFDVDLLRWSEALGLRVVERPVVWEHHDGSKLRVGGTIGKVLLALWRMKRRTIPADLVTLPPLSQPADSLNAPLRILALSWRCLKHPQSGGSEVNLFQQARHWVQDGHRVTVVTADPGREHAPQRDEIMDGIEVRRMGNRATVYLWAALFLLRHGRSYDRILDIANGIPFFAPLFTSTPSVLLVHHVHDRQWFVEFPWLIAAVGRFLECRLVPLIYHGHSVIAVSPTTRDALVRTGFGIRQIEVVYNGVDQPAAPPVPAQHTGRRIAFVGRLKQYKRIDLLIKAVAQLRAEFPDVKLDIVGDGDVREALEALARSLGLTETVTFYGFVSEEDKARIMGAAAVFATPSMHEGWGLSVIEANVYGCPAVAYNVPGLSVAIRHGETGLLANDDEAFRSSLALLLRDAALREQLAVNAQTWAKRFDWESTAHTTLNLLSAAGGMAPQAARS